MLDGAGSAAAGWPWILMDVERSESQLLHPGKISHPRCLRCLMNSLMGLQLTLGHLLITELTSGVRGGRPGTHSLLTVAMSCTTFISWKRPKETSALGMFSSWLRTVTSPTCSGPCAYHQQCQYETPGKGILVEFSSSELG